MESQQYKMKRQALRFEESGSLKLVSDETPPLCEREVLIKVHYSPVTQYDKACLSVQREWARECGEKLKRVICGSEGAGVIEQVGPNVDASLKGRKVAFCHDGWSQYVVKEIDHLLFFEDHVDLRKIAVSIVNPLTALSLKFMMLDRGVKSFVLLGPNSTFGHIMIKAALKKDIRPIIIAQNEDEAKYLYKSIEGIDKEYILTAPTSFEDSAKEDFFSRLRTLFTKENPTFLIDPVGSELSGYIFTRMPPNSELVVLGNLSNAELRLPTSEFFMHNKLIRGFNLETYIRDEVSDDRRKEMFRIIQDDFNKNEGRIFAATIAQEFRMLGGEAEWNKAIESVEKLQDKGKVLLSME